MNTNAQESRKSHTTRMESTVKPGYRFSTYSLETKSVNTAKDTINGLLVLHCNA